MHRISRIMNFNEHRKKIPWILSITIKPVKINRVACPPCLICRLSFCSFHFAHSKWRLEEEHTESLATVSTILTLVFLVEVIMKNIAFTPRGYWQSRRNRYDLLVTVVGVIWIVIHCTMQVRSSRILFFYSSIPMMSSCFIVWLSERSVLRDWIYGCDPEVLYYHWQTHHSQDANVDSWCVCLQELLYHIRHVSSCFFLRVSRHHNLRHSEIRRRYRKVRKIHYLRDFKIPKYVEYTCNV